LFSSEIEEVQPPIENNLNRQTRECFGFMFNTAREIFAIGLGIDKHSPIQSFMLAIAISYFKESFDRMAAEVDQVEARKSLLRGMKKLLNDSDQRLMYTAFGAYFFLRVVDKLASIAF
jgi:hypothetical protein